MSVEKNDAGAKTGFDYLVCLDLVVLACILVVAGRPDGLAITLSAIIIATGAVVFRCSTSVKSYLLAPPPKVQSGARNDERASGQVTQKAAVESTAVARAGGKSWLRESE